MSNSAEVLRSARSYVLWLLGRRDYSRMQLETRLKKRGLEKEEIAVLLDSLFDSGLYNEENFKRTRVRQLLKRGLAANAVKAKLRQDRCTVNDTDIAAGYGELQSSPLDELRALVEKAARKLDRGSELSADEVKKTRERLVQSLMRKGHRNSDVRKVIDEMLKAREA